MAVRQQIEVGPRHSRSQLSATRGYLELTHTHRAQFKTLTHVCTWISFSLLILTGVSLVISPITQEMWTWDRFLRGGQDFEFGVLLVLLSLSLVLLQAQHFRQIAELVQSGWSLKACTRYRTVVSRAAAVSDCTEDLPPPLMRNYRLPLTI